MNATLKKITIAGLNGSAFVVIVNGKEVGTISKQRGGKATTCPWKAYQGIGFASKMVAYFYEADGGKNAAIAAVLGS